MRQNLTALNMLRRRLIDKRWLVFAALLAVGPVFAQGNGARQNYIDSILSNQKGILRQLARNLLTDTAQETNLQLQRNDVAFRPYQGRVIRSISIQSLDFGVSIPDTTRSFKDKLTHLADYFHDKTKERVIRKNLFIHENERLSPFLTANNERYLRDLPLFHDARILVQPVEGTEDSVDVFVLTKDVLSLGGSLDMRNNTSGVLTAKEDNLLGWGDRLEFHSLYDQSRHCHAGFGGEYLKRNVGGSFLDASAGFLDFNNAFNSGAPEEKMAYVRLERPLVNPYMHWTYSVGAEWHRSENMYRPDSLYASDWKYAYHLFDAWAGLNLSTNRLSYANEYQHLRWLLGLRVMDQHFYDKPQLYSDHYYYSYADVRAVLASVSVFRLNYYKTRYIYGFGREEDVPEGLDASYTTGWTRKDGNNRWYNGLSWQWSHITKRQGIFNYTLRSGSYLHGKRMEDVSLIGAIDYYSRLHQLAPGWKHRDFLSVSYARQFNTLLDGPLMLESNFGLPGFKNNYRAGNLRTTARAESVFYSPWSILYFKMAPFVFGEASYFHLSGESLDPAKLYSGIGSGIRVRNESLIFGTIEWRITYYPSGDYLNRRFKSELNSNIRFKYNQPFIRKPDFVQLN
jgi:hypothetical protein